MGGYKNQELLSGSEPRERTPSGGYPQGDGILRRRSSNGSLQAGSSDSPGGSIGFSDRHRLDSSMSSDGESGEGSFRNMSLVGGVCFALGGWFSSAG